MSYYNISRVPLLARLRKKRCFRGEFCIDDNQPKTFRLNVSLDECLNEANKFLVSENKPAIEKPALLELFNKHGILV